MTLIGGDGGHGRKLTRRELFGFSATSAVSFGVATLAAIPNAKADYKAVAVCPYCGCVGYQEEDPTKYKIFTCHCCGRSFRA
jgi:hypothetical protein